MTQTINDTNKLFNNSLAETLLTLPPEVYDTPTLY